MNNKLKRIICAIVGNIIIGISIGILKLSKLGVDPLSFMNIAFANTLNIDFGTVITFTSFILIVIVFLGHRKSIGLGTIISMLFVGYSADFAYSILKIWHSNQFIINFVYLIIGINVVCIGAGIYLEANLGASAYDALPYVVNNVTNHNFPYKYTRIVLDVTCIVVALLLHEKIQIGTIILGFFTGPLIVFYRNKAKELIFKEC